jgi:hypothetical protein
LTSDESRVYVTCAPDEIAYVDLRDPAMPVRRVPLAPGVVELGNCARCPYALGIAPDGRVWVSSLGPNAGTAGRGSIAVFDPTLPGGGDFDQASVIQLRGSPVFATFVGGPADYRVYVPEQGSGGDHVRVLQPQPRGQQPQELGDIALSPGDCLNAHMLHADGTRAQLICEGNHTAPGTFVWLDLAQGAVVGSVKIGVFPDGLALVPAVH